MVKHLRVAVALTAITATALGTLAIRLNLGHSPSSSNGVLAAETDTSPESFSVPSNSEPTDRQPEEYFGSFFYRTATEMLQALHVQVYPEDKVYAFPDPSLGIGSRLKVYRAQPVLIKDGEEEYLVRTWAPTIADLIDEQRVEVGDKDIVQPARGQAIVPGPTATVAITRVSESNLTVTDVVPHGAQFTPDPNLVIGMSRTVKEGTDGQRQRVYMVRRENGKEVSRTLLSTKITKDPVDEIIAKGTKPKRVYLDAGQYLAYFNAASAQYNVPVDSLRSLMYCESGGNVNSLGAGGLYKGLYQFDDQTWSTTSYSSRSIFDPEAQILATASLWQYRAAKWPTCVAALGL